MLDRDLLSPRWFGVYRPARSHLNIIDYSSISVRDNYEKIIRFQTKINIIVAYPRFFFFFSMFFNVLFLMSSRTPVRQPYKPVYIFYTSVV